MERDAKRKAVGPPTVDNDTPRGTKRQRIAGAMDPSDETYESTTEIGLKFLDSVRNARDKTGRPIATDFLTLPDRNTPGYYESVKLPIALDTIEAKLRDGGYPNLSAVESDCKRMVANAKQFNEKNSSIYEDAERVRKTASNFMVRHNPAYRNPGYVAVATPLPDGEEEPTSARPTPYSTRYSSGGAERSRRSSQNTGRRSIAHAPAAPSESEPEPEPELEPEPEEEVEDYEGPGRFKGKAFEEVQAMLVQELIDHTDEELQIFTPFVNLPSRTLVDYYQVIKHPVSLKSVQKRVRGQHGRSAPTGISDFQSWDAFEEEVSYIWQNAQTYNEDGSEMYNLAAEFEEYFKEIFQQAKKVVNQPHQQTIKLKLGEPKQSGIKIKFGAARDSPGITPGPSTPGRSTPGVTVDNDALKRQQQMVNAGVNGARAGLTNGVSRNPFTGSGSSASIPQLHASRSTSAATPPALTNGVKGEGAAPSPALNAAQPVTAHLAPASRPASGGTFSQPQTVSHHYQGVPVDGPPAGLVSSKFRAADEGPSDYLLPSLHISSHPGLNLTDPFSIRIPASSKTLYQSVTFTVPALHYYLQITPNIPVGLTSRPYRLFVSINGTKISETVKAGSTERDKSNPIFEARLERGAVHKIDVEVLAVKQAKTGKDEVQWEKISCLVHIMRS